MTNCITCALPFSFRWTDSHGVGVCSQCGTPYAIYQYDENNQRIDAPPACCLHEAGQEIATRYWAEVRDWVFPAAFDMGFIGDRSSTYSGATREQIEKFHDWYDAQKDAPPAFSDVESA